MRADRLLSLLLLLQHRGRLSAKQLADELEVSPRTVLRDVEALSSAGVPVYAERGRHGGFALLPGYSTDLTGLTHDEAIALLVAGSRGEGSGMAPALASAMRKVVVGLPAAQRAAAGRDAGRILLRGDGFLPHSRPAPDDTDDDLLATVRGAVFAGRRLDVRYAARAEEEPRWRIVDPVGLVSAGGRWYLLATRDGQERTYRLSRMREVRSRAEPAVRPPEVDLDRAWRDRRAAFPPTRPGVTVTVRVQAGRRAELTRTARAVTAEAAQDGRLRMTVEFFDLLQAERVLWALGADVEVLAPADLRAALADRAVAIVARYAGPAGA